MDDMVKLRLVPVQIFNAGRCPDHGSDTEGNNPTRCSECRENVEGYGIMDAVSPWSDCNRAIGHIYRIDDADYRYSGENIEIFVNKNDLSFFEKEWCGE